MKNRVNICKSTIEDAFKEGWHDSLYYYVKLKSTYKKPIFYNFTYRNIALKIDASPSVVSKHIKVLIKKDLAYIHNGNLCFYSLNKILQKNEGKSKSVINLPVWIEKRKMIDELRGVLIVQRLNNQISRIFKLSAIVKKMQIANAVITKGELNFIRKCGGIDKIESSISPRVTLSNQSIGLEFYRSQSSGKIYQRRLNTLGVLRSKAEITILMKDFHPEMLRYAKSTKFFRTRNNELARQDSNTLWSPYMKSFRELRLANPIKIRVGKEFVLEGNWQL